METKQLKDAIVLIGPKAVGKTLIAERLLTKLDDYVIFSSDKLENYAMMFTQGGFRSLNELKNVVANEFSDERALKKYSGDPEEIKKRNQEYVKDYLDSIDFYSSFVDFVKLRHIVYETIKILTENKNLTLRQQLFVMQYQKIKMLKEAFLNMNKNLLCDFGADLGCNINLTQKEQQQIARIYNKPFSSIKNAQKSLFQNLGKTIYLEAGIDYKEKVDPRSGDAHNKIYLEDKGSYVDFTDLVISMNGTFNDPSNFVFRNDNDFDPSVSVAKEKLKNKANIENICDQILLELEIMKQMQ